MEDEVKELTPRHIEILTHIAQGAQDKEMIDDLHISINTLRNFVREIFDRLGAVNRPNAVFIATKKGLI